MSNTDNLPCLSPETVTALTALRGSDKDKFYAYVRALRIQGWPLRAVAEPLVVSRTAVQGWERKYDPQVPLPQVETIPEPAPQERTSGSKRKELPQHEIDSLRHLTQQASTVRRYTDGNSESRRSAAVLESRLVSHRNDGISITQLADACGVSRSAIAQRLRKYK